MLRHLSLADIYIQIFIACLAGFPSFPPHGSVTRRFVVCVICTSCSGLCGNSVRTVYKFNTRKEHELFHRGFEVLRFIFSAVVFGEACRLSYSYVINTLAYTQADPHTFILAYCMHKYTDIPWHSNR